MVSSISNWESTAHKQCHYIKLCWCVLSSHKRFEIQSPSRFQPVGAVDHDQCFQWGFDGVGVIQPLVSMVFNGYGPLVQQCDGFNGSFTSKLSQKFKLADPAVEGDPGIWHRSFWLPRYFVNLGTPPHFRACKKYAKKRVNLQQNSAYWLEGYRVYGICPGPTPTIYVRYTMNHQ